MATTPRPGKPYIWVTWITGVLAGKDGCRFAPWFRAHFRYEKLEDEDFDLAAWSADHARLVARRRDELVADGWTVTMEDENRFVFHGRFAILGGKPDLIARKPGVVLISDAKTGKVRDSDWWQVLVYLLAVPRCFPDCRDVAISGEVVYKTHTIPVVVEELNATRKAEIFDLLVRLGGEVRPPQVPSAGGCARCDISAVDCERRHVPVDDPVDVAAEF